MDDWIKPCPRCRKSPCTAQPLYDDPPHFYYGWNQVECYDCGLQSNAQTLGEAAEKWNAGNIRDARAAYWGELIAARSPSDTP